MSAPVCRLCGVAHWSTEKHVFRKPEPLVVNAVTRTSDRHKKSPARAKYMRDKMRQRRAAGKGR